MSEKEEKDEILTKKGLIIIGIIGSISAISAIVIRKKLDHLN